MTISLSVVTSIPKNFGSNFAYRINANQDDGINFIEQFVSNIESGLNVNLGLTEDDQNTLKHYQLLLAEIDDKNSILIRKRIGVVLDKVKKHELKNVGEVEFRDIFEGFSAGLLDLIGKNIRVVQCTKGCSLGCPNCNFMALLLPRQHLSWNAINEIMDRWGTYLKQNDAFFYYSSDPLDWENYEGRNYIDIARIAKEKCGYYPEATTAIPIGKEELAKELWYSEVPVRISPSNVNLIRLVENGILEKVEDNQYRVLLGKPGNPFSHIIDSGPSSFNLRSGKQGKLFLGEKQNLVYRVGKDFDYSSVRSSIGCVKGVQVHPDGVYNFVATATTPQTPNGYVRSRIVPEMRSVFVGERWHNFSRNNMLPYKRDVLQGDSKEQELTDNQCFEAIYEIIANTLITSNKLKVPGADLTCRTTNDSSFFSDYIMLPSLDSLKWADAIRIKYSELKDKKDRLIEKYPGLRNELDDELSEHLIYGLKDSSNEYLLKCKIPEDKINECKQELEILFIERRSLSTSIMNSRKESCRQNDVKDMIITRFHRTLDELHKYMNNNQQAQDEVIKAISILLQDSDPVTFTADLEKDKVELLIDKTFQQLKLKDPFELVLRLSVYQIFRFSSLELEFPDDILRRASFVEPLGIKRDDERKILNLPL